MTDTKTVLVTGANSGVGLATVVELARRGMRVVGTVRSEAKAVAVEEAAAQAGVLVETRLLDVTDADRCAAVIAELELDALVNNAGYGLTGAVEDVSDDEARRLFETMVFAPLRLARLAVPGMRARGEGRIVMVSSIYGRVSTPLTGWYQAAKHALEGISDALRMEVARDGIRVILIEPGGLRTGIWDDLHRDVESRGGSAYGDAYRRTEDMMRRASPLMGEPERCAQVIAAAITGSRPRSRYLVGVDARLTALAAQTVPTPIQDRLTRRVLGL
jgi:NAD(P)-dependent dehydrogenase (short-subunit alcohol dehydrogenase family)